MKKQIKLALLAAAAGVIAVSAQAQNDLIVGFTVGSGTDFIYDLGSDPTALSNGQTWNLGSSLTSAGLTSLSSVQWGVLGDDNNTTLWSSSVIGVPPHKVANSGALTGIDTAISAITQNFTGVGPGGYGAGDNFTIAAGSQNSWYSQTINPSLNTQYKNVEGVPTPNVTGTVSDSFYSLHDNNTAPTLLGSFSLSSGGVLTFNVAPVPEPSTYCILAGGGLLLLSMRRQFRSKQV